LILSLSGMHLRTYVDITTTIFTVDLSESMRNKQDEVKMFIDKSLEYTSENDRVGVVTFGQRSEIENAVSDDLKMIEFQTNPGEEFTNIEDSLKLARGIIPDNTKKRIVLLTDGEENIGNSLNKSNLLKYNDVELKVYKVDKIDRPEVQLTNVDIPRALYQNQRFNIVANIYSNIKTKSKLTLYADRQVVGQEEVTIEKGENKFVFEDVATEGGFKPYKIVIEPDEDTILQNNTYSAFTEVEGTAKILLVDGENDGGREIYKILTSAKIDVDYVKDREVPRTLPELLKYKAIVMSDVSLENINNDYINILRNYVRDYGGGLVVTGGENSYALGGYYQTPLEEILPVNMEMKIKGEVPNLGLMLVIDKSGSMEGSLEFSKIELAKEAAVRALDSLRIKDKIGVIAFDGSVQWVVDLSNVDKKEDIKNAIGTIRAGGGTSILPALDEAYLKLKDVDTKLKHVILLTDGYAEREGYSELIENMQESGITISTVAVGEGADIALLESIAREGKGRYYQVDEYSNIPKIFTKETFLAAKTYINNRKFVPKVGSYHDIINPFMNGIPELDGYIGASSKDRAEVILWSDKEDPILAAWQYGLGNSVAWTSDINGKWTSDYLTSEEGQQFFRNMIEWTISSNENSNLLVESNIVDDKGELLIRNAGDFSEEYKTKVLITTPEVETMDLEVKSSKPGEYIAKFPAIEQGVYIVNINQYKEDEIINNVNYGVAVNYPKEYDFTSLENRLDILVNKTEGKYITKPDEVFTKY